MSGAATTVAARKTRRISTRSTPPHRYRDARRTARDTAEPQHTMTTTLGCFSAGLGRRTDLPWPLPADAGQVREKGYFVEGGKESLPPKWDSKVPPPLPDENVSGVDAYHKKLEGEVDGNGEPTIAVFLKTGPPGRAPALVVEGVSVTADASVLADRAAKDLGVPVDACTTTASPQIWRSPSRPRASSATRCCSSGSRAVLCCSFLTTRVF